jgi:hypothetical protein
MLLPYNIGEGTGRHSPLLYAELQVGEPAHLLLLALTVVQLDKFLDCGRILRLLVCLPECDQAGKAQRVARLIPDFPCGMDR